MAVKRTFALAFALALLASSAFAVDQKESALSTATAARANLVTGLQAGANVNFTLGGIADLATIPCANVTNAGTVCTINTGTSGGTVGLLNANKTDSGTNTFSGTTNTFSSALVFSGLSSGTIATGKFIGLDSGNNVVLAAGGGGGGTFTLTDGVHTQTGVTTLSLGPGLVTTTGSSGTGPINISAPNRSSSSAITFTSADFTGQVNSTGTTNTATIPGTGTLGANQSILLTNQGSGVVTNTDSQTVNGLALPTKLHSFGFYAYTGNGTSADAFGFPGFDTITTNALTKFSDGSGATTASTIVDNGGIVVNAATGGAQGAGTINASGLYVNGVAVGASSGCVVSGTQGQILAVDVTGLACNPNANAVLSGTGGAILTLGASGTNGSLFFWGGTHNTQINAAAATANHTIQFPDLDGTVDLTDAAQSVSANKTFGAGNIILTGASGCGTFTAGVLSGTGSACGSGGGGTTIVAPQGRLTLVAGTPVMTADETAKATIYYDCYVGNQVPYYTGSADALDTIASCEVSDAMVAAASAGQVTTTGVFDVWWVHGGANRICIAMSAATGGGGGWASDTAGSNTARGTGYSAVHNTRGYWTNTNSITNCFNGATNYGPVTADEGTYLGTIYSTAAGQTGMAFKPAGASAGTAPILGLWNAYNRVQVGSLSQDTKASWTYTTATWRPADNSTANRVTWVDGLAQSSVQAAEIEQGVKNDASVAAYIGVSLNSTTAGPGVASSSNANSFVGQSTSESFPPVSGLNYAQAMEYCTSGTCSYVGYLSLTVSLSM